ncbi:type 1 glutamine amidotransferase domain-containing protein [Novosphingobium flavum]|uniref:Type 1 glutamine amidotransferase domain-containing protein n=1 Tax=Novosphingobium flavum TaxID=1778672 RepID=A0A7X1FPJ8_9SPHN|nr:type 1 glutamine amidotransferase domain-containing protein [Novosphingobium flavum]MBC2664595.1 type 1 glutamine amidotransferase domain-containing protein [Novosphingobium flavum]
MTKILMVLTSHDSLGETGEKTGYWFEEFAAPYYTFKDNGAEIVLASPKGGQPPRDPKSDAPDAQSEATERFTADAEGQAALAATLPLGEVDVAAFDAVFYPGGHGPLWDLAESAPSIALIETALGAGKPVGLVCHGPAALRRTRAADGEPLVKGRRVTGFSNSEEAIAGLTAVVPFSIEDEFKALGGLYEKGEDWSVHAVVDGQLVTGQNPASSVATAEAVLALLG